MVRQVPEGIATTYLHEHVSEGDEVKFTGPFGEFYLRDTDRRMICIAGGSGMAPIRSILLSMSKEQVETKKPIFFFGARARKDLFLVDEWRRFEEENPDFKFVPVLSQPDPDDNWEGDTGPVPEIIGKYVQDVTEAEAYLCGSPGMLNACIEALTKMNLPEERIYYDKFA
jgi:Na+-transporting NADH:ubiquinone oxidoreductase subunit F